MASVTNLRIVADNAAERATLTASSTAGALVVTNLLAARKSQVWRATSTSATLTLTWTSPEIVSMVALLGNFSPTTTIRVRGYSDSAGNTQVLDTGAPQLACPAPAVQLRGWPAAKSASAYAYGGGAIARAWFAETSVQCLKIDLVDTANLQGALEAAWIVAGRYWSPTYTAADAPWSLVDGTTDYRTGAGDLLSQVGTINTKVSIDLSLLPSPTDRAMVARMLRNSRAFPIFLSIYPGSADLELERDNTVYGKRTGDSEIAWQFASTYSTKVEIQSI
jgi:hypothetical protein